MDLPLRCGGDCTKETTNHSLGIPITMDALQKKLFAAQGSQLRLFGQYMSSVSRLKEKDQVIDLVRSEASINAQALKKIVEENQELRGECDDLVNQCKDLKRKCFIYQLDLGASKRSGNESEERAREAECMVQELEQELKHMSCVNKKQQCSILKLERAEKEVERVREQNRELNLKLLKQRRTSRKRKRKRPRNDEQSRNQLMDNLK